MGKQKGGGQAGGDTNLRLRAKEVTHLTELDFFFLWVGPPTSSREPVTNSPQRATVQLTLALMLSGR